MPTPDEWDLLYEAINKNTSLPRIDGMDPFISRLYVETHPTLRIFSFINARPADILGFFDKAAVTPLVMKEDYAAHPENSYETAFYALQSYIKAKDFKNIHTLLQQHPLRATSEGRRQYQPRRQDAFADS